jgi:sialidase-1
MIPRRTFLAATAPLLFSQAAKYAPQILSVLPPTPGNPRNTEGDFLPLRDGRILFAYTKFTGGGGDHATAHIAARYSSDLGQTWTPNDVTLLENEGGLNVMSVSLLRLKKSGRIAFFYLRKDSDTKCAPFLRYSTDEGNTWTRDPVPVIQDNPGYHVLNNDRVIQTSRGRLLAPVALHTTADGKWTGRGSVRVYMSDDEGQHWRRSPQILECPDAANATGLQEPGVVELKGGRLMLFCRTALGSQYVSYSTDGGESWTAPGPSALVSPVSPASIERIPKTGHLLAVWNDHTQIAPELARRRTPLTLAISRDEGKTWERKRNILEDPKGWYCYTAIEFVKDRILLGFASGGTDGLKGLSRTQIASIPLQWLYR